MKKEVFDVFFHPEMLKWMIYISLLLPSVPASIEHKTCVIFFLLEQILHVLVLPA